MPLAALAVLPETGDAAVVLGAARVDASGRVPARGVCRAMGWSPGQRLAINVRDGTIVLAVCGIGGIGGPGGVAVTGRSELALPAAARQLCAIDPGSWLLLAALTTRGAVVMHRESVVIQPLAGVHRQLLDDRISADVLMGERDVC